MKYASIWLMATFFLLTIAQGCAKETINDPVTIDTLTRSFLALGDSYTIGESVSQADRFPAQTIAFLKAKGIQFTAPTYIARTGWTTTDLQNAINKTNLNPMYDIVTLLIGVNDQYQGLDTAGYRTRFTRLLQTAVQLAGNIKKHVFVLSIPDYGVTPFGGGSVRISKEIADFNAINKQVTLANDILYVDITPISKTAAVDQTLTANDGLHPSGKQYSLWAMKMAEAVTQ